MSRKLMSICWLWIIRLRGGPSRGGFPENWSNIRPFSDITDRWLDVSPSELIDGVDQGVLNHSPRLFHIRPLLEFGHEKFAAACSGKDVIILLWDFAGAVYQPLFTDSFEGLPPNLWLPLIFCKSPVGMP